MAKLVISPSKIEMPYALKLSQAMKKYALNAHDLDSHPKVRNNLAKAMAQAYKANANLLVAEQKRQQLQKLTFGANYPTNRADRLARASAIIGSAAGVNGGVCLFTPPVVDLCATALSSLAMGSALADLYGAEGSAWTISTMSSVMTSLAISRGPEYLIKKSASWLAHFIPIPGVGTSTSALLEGGLAASTMAGLGVGTVALFEAQIQAGREPRLPQEVRQICTIISAASGAFAVNGIAAFLGQLAQGHGADALGNALGNLVSNGGDRVFQDIMRTL